jgi:hypothetical protein
MIRRRLLFVLPRLWMRSRKILTERKNPRRKRKPKKKTKTLRGFQRKKRKRKKKLRKLQLWKRPPAIQSLTSSRTR